MTEISSSIAVEDINKSDSVSKSHHSKEIREAIKECICIICHDILLEPVTLVCGHSLCLGCFGQLKSMKSSSSDIIKCPMCHKAMKNTISVNLVLSDILKKLGGRRYKKRIQTANLSKLYDKVIAEYCESSRYDLLYSIIEDYIGEKKIVEHSDIVDFFFQYDECELTFILCEFLQENGDDYVVHNNTIINNDQVTTYISNNKLHAKDEIMILLSFIDSKKSDYLNDLSNYLKKKYHYKLKKSFIYPYLDIIYPNSKPPNLKKRKPLIELLLHLNTQRKKDKKKDKYVHNSDDCTCEECSLPFFRDCIDDDKSDEIEESYEYEDSGSNKDSEVIESEVSHESSYEYEDSYYSYSDEYEYEELSHPYSDDYH